MRLLFVAVTGVSIVVAGSAAAQMSGNAANMRAESAVRMDRFSAQLSEHALDAQTGQNSDNQNPRRLRRARDAAEMINHGDCAGARALADRDGDHRLAARIDQVCATFTVSAPTAVVPAPSPTPAPQ